MPGSYISLKEYSLKNIPILSNEPYLIKLNGKIESVVKRMRWRAHFFLQEKRKIDIKIEDFGLKSKSTSSHCEHMEAFEKEFFDMMTNIKFRSVKDAFQKKLTEDIPKVKQSPNIFAFADKTSQINEMPEKQHKKPLHNNVTKAYRKTPKQKILLNLLTWIISSSV